MKYTFYGDIHGGMNDFIFALRANSESDKHIQVGDFGFGFLRQSSEKKLERIMDEFPNMRMIRGNHDDPALAKQHPKFITDGHTEITPEGVKIMYVGGAWSIDHAFRTPGLSWWPDEELSNEEFKKVEEIYGDFKPDIMVTHDCPQYISTSLFIQTGLAMYGGAAKVFKTRTAQMFEHFHLNVHKPKVWLFGHWHHDETALIDGTQFVCAGEFSSVTVDMEKVNDEDFTVDFPKLKWSHDNGRV